MALVDDFKGSMAAWASGVTVVATRAGGQAYGITASSFSSVSLDPPLVSVCIGEASALTRMIAEAGAFSVSVLGRDQEAASNHFASRSTCPHDTLGGEGSGLEVVELAGGMPAVGGAMAHLSCTVEATHTAGDHLLVIGRVVEARPAHAEARPLIYWSRAYRGVTP